MPSPFLSDLLCCACCVRTVQVLQNPMMARPPQAPQFPGGPPPEGMLMGPGAFRHLFAQEMAMRRHAGGDGTPTVPVPPPDAMGALDIAFDEPGANGNDHPAPGDGDQGADNAAAAGGKQPAGSAAGANQAGGDPPPGGREARGSQSQQPPLLAGAGGSDGRGGRGSTGGGTAAAAAATGEQGAAGDAGGRASGSGGAGEAGAGAKAAKQQQEQAVNGTAGPQQHDYDGGAGLEGELTG